MISKKKRIVLFLPHRGDPSKGVRVSADLLPLELLQIAVFPEREGYEVHIVDAMVHEDYLERLMELCDGALCFASSCMRLIVGCSSSVFARSKCLCWLSMQK